MNPERALPSRIRVLAVSHDAYMYGAQRSLLDAVDGLLRAGHEVHVCAPQPGLLTDVLQARGVQVHLVRFLRWIPAASNGGLRDWLRFLACFPFGVLRACRLVRSGAYDVVYTNTVTVLDFAVAARLLRVPHVWHVREAAAGNPQLRSPLSNRAVIALVRALSAGVIYNSQALLARYGGPSSERDQVVHNGFQDGGGFARRASDGADRPAKVVTAGFMDRRKGLDVLLDAMLLLPQVERARMVLYVAGEIEPGYRASEIEPRLQRLGSQVVLLGWIESIDEVIASADLLVSSARDEPFGRTLVEGMLHGVAVLATRSGGPQEIVVDGVTGLLVPVDDPAALRDSLRCLLGERQLLATFGQAGRDRALAKFSLAAHVREVEHTLLQAVTRRPART